MTVSKLGPIPMPAPVVSDEPERPTRPEWIRLTTDAIDAPAGLYRVKRWNFGGTPTVQGNNGWDITLPKLVWEPADTPGPEAPAEPRCAMCGDTQSVSISSHRSIECPSCDPSFGPPLAEVSPVPAEPAQPRCRKCDEPWPCMVQRRAVNPRTICGASVADAVGHTSTMEPEAAAEPELIAVLLPRNTVEVYAQMGRDLIVEPKTVAQVVGAACWAALQRVEDGQ